jgi:serpin B
MKDDLAGMGMPVAFTDQADFTGMYDSTNLPPLAISHIAHKAFIAVDEKGTEAAAATDIIMIPMAGHQNTVILRIDHPFIFAIRDRQTGSLLFIGRVLDPRAH